MTVCIIITAFDEKRPQFRRGSGLELKAFCVSGVLRDGFVFVCGALVLNREIGESGSQRTTRIHAFLEITTAHFIML